MPDEIDEMQEARIAALVAAIEKETPHTVNPVSRRHTAQDEILEAVFRVLGRGGYGLTRSEVAEAVLKAAL